MEGLFEPGDDLLFVGELAGVFFPLAHAVAAVLYGVEFAAISFGFEGFAEAGRLLVGDLSSAVPWSRRKGGSLARTMK